jgi:hypothetical protein
MAVRRSSGGTVKSEQAPDLEQVAFVLGLHRLLIAPRRLNQIQPSVQRFDFGEERYQRYYLGFAHDAVAEERWKRGRVRDVGSRYRGVGILSASYVSARHRQ